MHLKKVGGYIGQNGVRITFIMRSEARIIFWKSIKKGNIFSKLGFLAIKSSRMLSIDIIRHDVHRVKYRIVNTDEYIFFYL